jgi:hypothetical protein
MQVIQALPDNICFFRIGAEDIFFNRQNPGPHLFNLHGFDIEFPAADNLHSLSLAFRTAVFALLHWKKQIAVAASQLRRHMRAVDFSAMSNGVFAKEAEIELHGFVHNAGVISNNQIDANDSASARFSGVLQRKAQ